MKADHWPHRAMLWCVAAQFLLALPVDYLKLGWPFLQDSPPFLVVLQYPKVLVIISTAIATAFLLSEATRRRLAIDSLGALMIAGTVMATLVGFVKAALGIHPMRFVAPHLASGLMVTLTYLAFINIRAIPVGWLFRFIERLSRWLTFLSALFLGLFLLRRIGGTQGLYWGFNSLNLLLPFAWYVARRRYGMVLLTIGLVAINGKRGVVVALIAGVGALLLLDVVRRGATAHLRAALVAVTAAIFVLVGAGVIASVDPDRLPLGLADTVAKWDLLNPARETFDPNIGSSGRFAEIQESLSEFAAQPASWAVGGGYGWWFISSYRAASDEYTDFRLHYVHFSPLNFLYQYGVVMFLGLLAVICVQLVQAMHVYAGLLKPTPYQTLFEALFILVVADLVGGLTGYSYGTDASIWIALGLLRAMTLNAAGSRGATAALAPSARV